MKPLNAVVMPKPGEVLAHLLNAVVMPKPGEEVEGVILLNPFSEKEAEEEKEIELDVVACDSKNRLFGVEMQQVAPRSYPERLLYYWGRRFGSHLVAGESYTKLPPTSMISFINSKCFPGEASRRRFRTIDEADGLVLSNHLAIYTIELPKFNLTKDELTTPLEVWSYFLRKAESLDTETLPKALDIPPIRKTMEVLKAMSMNTRDRGLIEARLRAEHDLATQREEGIQDGIEKGIEKGIEQGALIGRVQLSQELLGLPISSREELKALAPGELLALDEQLKPQVKLRP